MANQNHGPAEFIQPLYMNGLNGRMLRKPGPQGVNREILFIYGHHSTLERWWGVIEDLGQYGTITVPDMPGFGGMDSFYTIGQKPNIDAMADYLAAFVKLHYRRRRVTIAGLSWGFIVVTRMLQRYPDLTKKVDVLISVVGFAHKDDFTFSRRRFTTYLFASRVLSRRLPAVFFKNVFLHPTLLRLVYARTHNAKHKFAGTSPEEFKRLMDMEVHLWHSNDLRTHMATSAAFLTVDNCQKRVDLPVWHISVKGEKYFDTARVEQHFRVIFNDYNHAQSNFDNHAPTVIATKEQSAPLIPQKIRDVLSS